MRRDGYRNTGNIPNPPSPLCLGPAGTALYHLRKRVEKEQARTQPPHGSASVKSSFKYIFIFRLRYTSKSAEKPKPSH